MTFRSFIERIPLVLIGTLLTVLAIREIGSLDMGFHLAAGNHIVDGRGWPRMDPFSYTMRDHPYVDTSWGYQVAVALVERVAGSAGIVVLHALFLLATFFLLFRTVHLVPVRPVAVAVLLLAGVLASEMRFEARPEAISYLLLALELYWLHRYAEGQTAPLRLIPVIHWIWANSHSLFILGLIAQVVFMTGIAFRDRQIDRRLLRAFAISIAVSFLTPYGWRGFVFPFTLLSRFQGGNPFAQTIGEFVSPFSLHLSEQYPFWPRLSVGAFRALGLAAVLAAPGLVKSRRFPSLLLAAVFGALGARMIRNMPLFVIATLPGTAWGLTALASGRRRRRTRKGQRAATSAPAALFARFGGPVASAAVALVMAMLTVRVLTNAYYLESRRVERFGWGWNGNVQPIGAARWADKVGLHSPMLNHLNFGGFLMWARPDPVFIDGRLEVVGETFYRQYNDVLASADAREACVARYGIGWIVFPYATNPWLLGELSEDLRWRLAYRDHLAVIFVRSGPGADAYVDPLLAEETGELGATRDPSTLPGLGTSRRPGKAARFLSGFVRRERFPTEEFNRGLFHYYRGELGRAEGDFEEAILASGGRYYEIYNNLGAVLYRQKRGPEAIACYRIVLEEDPANRLALERMSALRGRGALR